MVLALVHDLRLTVVGLAVSKQRRTMGLQSKSFKDDPKLEACLVSDPAHIFRGAAGDHVRKIQDALIKTDGASIDRNELDRKFYGNSTAQAILNFKTNQKRLIRNYKGEFDDIVGVKTIRALDLELAGVTNQPRRTLLCWIRRWRKTLCEQPCVP